MARDTAADYTTVIENMMTARAGLQGWKQLSGPAVFMYF